MAHVAKYQASALGRMCEHYDRTPELQRGYVRENVDSARTHLNFNLAPEREGGQVAFINERIASLGMKRAVRKDAVRMCDCIVTMPRSLDDSRRDEFFAAAYEFLAARYGYDNVVSAYVHMDEARPHMHFAWVPVTEDGRLSAKEVVGRADLRTLHGDMQGHLEGALGCRVEVLLDDARQGEKQLSALSQSEYVAAKDELAATKTRLEHLQRSLAEAEAEPAQETVSESLRTLYKARGAGSREEELGREIEGLRERIRASERRNGELRERVGELAKRVAEGRGRLAELRERIERALGGLQGAYRTIEAYVVKAREVPSWVGNAMMGVAMRVGASVYYEPRGGWDIGSRSRSHSRGGDAR